MSVMLKYSMDPSPAGGGMVCDVPKGAMFRHCAPQGDAVAIWLEVPDASAETEQRWFRSWGTGLLIEGDDLVYRGTVLFDEGRFVIHVYEVWPGE